MHGQALVYVLSCDLPMILDPIVFVKMRDLLSQIAGNYAPRKKARRLIRVLKIPTGNLFFQII